MMSKKKGKFNEKDSEMIQLTKMILKQTAQHTWKPSLEYHNLKQQYRI